MPTLAIHTARSFEEASRVLNGYAPGTGRRVAGSTWLYKVRHDALCLVLRQTPIITYLANGSFILTTGGHPTTTTARRMGEYMPLEFVFRVRREYNTFWLPLVPGHRYRWPATHDCTTEQVGISGTDHQPFILERIP